jgi:hypothetical protein
MKKLIVTPALLCLPAIGWLGVHFGLGSGPIKWIPMMGVL